MLGVVWQGLALKPNITSLVVRFPSTRLPSPITVAPSFPNLKYLAFTHIDPLCYPDVISEMLLEALKLEHLKLHFSPRMREERDPSTTLYSYFAPFFGANKRLGVKSLAIQNAYVPSGKWAMIYDYETIEALTMLDSAGGVDDQADLTFLAEPPVRIGRLPRLRFLRGNKVSRRHCEGMGKMFGLSKYYLVSGRELYDDRNAARSRSGSTRTGSRTPSVAGTSPSHRSPTNTLPENNSPRSVIASGQGYGHTPPRTGTAGSEASYRSTVTQGSHGSNPDIPVIALGPAYLDTIFRKHGRTLTHLLLLPQWRLTSEDMARLVRSCQQVQQLGCAVEYSQTSTLRQLIPYLPHLHALRILDPSDDSSLSDEVRKAGDEYADYISTELSWETGREFGNGVSTVFGGQSVQLAPKLRWVGLGDHVFEVLSGWSEMDDGSRKRKVEKRKLKDVRYVEIWRNDTLEIVFDDSAY